jgi:hypothetical protein
MPFINTDVLDSGLSNLKSTATHIYITNAEATTRTQAVTTFALGNKSFGAGNVFPAAISAYLTTGRKVTSAAVTDGSVTVTGTASHWAVVDGTRLLATGALSAPQAVTNGNTFTLTAFDVSIPGAV